MLESMQQLLGEVRSSEVQKREAATKLRAEIQAATNRIEGGPGWTPEQEVRRVGDYWRPPHWQTLDSHHAHSVPLLVRS